jgi:hypothetical protein
MTRVCVYTRISTDAENQPTSQHERLEAFCKVQEDWRVIATTKTEPPAPSSTGPASKPRSTSHAKARSTSSSSTASTDSAARCASSRASPRSWTP